MIDSMNLNIKNKPEKPFSLKAREKMWEAWHNYIISRYIFPKNPKKHEGLKLQ